MKSNQITNIKVLHVLNGQCMYDLFEKEQRIKEGMMVPFNEAMCVGEATTDLFSKVFIEKRCEAHHVSIEDYTRITLEPLRVLLEGNFDEVVLWFDEDMFCQINLLTALTYLEQIGFSGKKTLHIVDKKWEIIQTSSIPEQCYLEIFKEVVIDKKLDRAVELQVMAEGIRDYLRLQDKDNEIIQYIRANKEKTKRELLEGAMETFSRYGLGDVQYVEMIQKVTGK